jgi:tRNA(Ile2) C34 agmatinyltransferase TiaS
MQLKELTARQKLACPACGGEAQWNPAKKALICAFCGTESPYEIKTDGEIVEHDLVAALQAIPPDARGWQDERRSVRCQHCQAISSFTAAQQGKACDF